MESFSTRNSLIGFSPLGGPGLLPVRLYSGWGGSVLDDAFRNCIIELIQRSWWVGRGTRPTVPCPNRWVSFLDPPYGSGGFDHAFPRAGHRLGNLGRAAGRVPGGFPGRAVLRPAVSRLRGRPAPLRGAPRGEPAADVWLA